MKNKVLINVYVPSLDETYEVYIPVNESINTILELICKTIFDLSDSDFSIDSAHYLLDPDTTNVYLKNQLVRETNIVNSKKIILI